MFCSLLLTLLLWTAARCSLNFFETDRTSNNDNLQFDCLHNYAVSSEAHVLYQYCIRPINDSDLLSSNFISTYQQNFTFAQLQRLQVTTEQLFSWSAAIDLIERYQFYIDQYGSSTVSSEIFFNCTAPWFGPRCQYLFDLDDDDIFVDSIIQITREEQEDSDINPVKEINLTCYIHLECNRGWPLICLDWREVCDGRIDCLNEGIDEAYCSDLEMNECKEDEFRCQNGQCIPIEFWDDQDTECLDRSDEKYEYLIKNDHCHINSKFACEEHSCRQGFKSFVCGDGECTNDFGLFGNKRHVLMDESMKDQGNLSNECWMVMVCLTKIVDEVENTSCANFFRNFDINDYIRDCENLTQFPTIPILFSHVRFPAKLFRGLGSNE